MPFKDPPASWKRSQTERPRPTQRGPFYLLTVEVQDLRVPANLSGPFHGPGEAAALLPGGSSAVLDGKQILPGLSFSLSRPRGVGLSWRLTCPSSLPRAAPFRSTLACGSQGHTDLIPCGCRPFLSQQGEQASFRLSFPSMDLPRTAFGGKPRGCRSPQSTSADPWGMPGRLAMHFFWVDLPPVSPLMELWLVGGGALSAMHTAASRWCWWGEFGAEAGWGGSNGFRWGSEVTSCRAEWVVERESQGLVQSAREEENMH